MVLAWDRPGDEGVRLRDELRPAHAVSITELFEAGSVLFGAGIYDENETVRGSIIITCHESRDDLDSYLESEPFQVGRLWASVEVHPLKVPEMYIRQ